jgi:hypothetical protein
MFYAFYALGVYIFRNRGTMMHTSNSCTHMNAYIKNFGNLHVPQCVTLCTVICQPEDKVTVAVPRRTVIVLANMHACMWPLLPGKQPRTVTVIMATVTVYFFTALAGNCG